MWKASTPFQRCMRRLPVADTTFQDNVQCVLLPPSRLLLPIFGSSHKKNSKNSKILSEEKPFGLFFLKIEFSLSIGPSSMKNMQSNFNLCIFKLSQPIFIFKNIVGRKPHFKTMFNVYYFPLHGCCYLFLSPPQKNTKNSKTLSGENLLDFSSSKLNFVYQQDLHQ